VTWKIDARQGNEGYKIRWEIIQWTRGRGLDLGCGPQKTFPHFIGLDNNIDAQLFGIPANPDIRVDTCENLSLFSSKSMDFVFSSHLLEHIPPENVTACLEEWMRVIRLNGYLVLYLPDKSLYPNVGQLGANKDHKWDPDYESVVSFAEKVSRGWDLIDYQLRDNDNEYSGLYVFKVS
jgi:predicted SAM-dependent methyltransferase